MTLSPHAPLLAALASIGLSVAAQFALKRGMASEVGQAVAAGATDWRSLLHLALHPGVLGGLALYAAGAVVWLAVLARWDVSKAYPLVGLGFVATVILGWCVGENVTVLRVLGVAAICIGVVLIAKS